MGRLPLHRAAPTHVVEVAQGHREDAESIGVNQRLGLEVRADRHNIVVGLERIRRHPQRLNPGSLMSPRPSLDCRRSPLPHCMGLRHTGDALRAPPQHRSRPATGAPEGGGREG